MIAVTRVPAAHPLRRRVSSRLAIFAVAYALVWVAHAMLR
jgi:hypothetical protein